MDYINNNKVVCFHETLVVIKVNKCSFKLKDKLWWKNEDYRKFCIIEIERRKSLGNSSMGCLCSKDSLEGMINAGLDARNDVLDLYLK